MLTLRLTSYFVRNSSSDVIDKIIIIVRHMLLQTFLLSLLISLQCDDDWLLMALLILCNLCTYYHK